MPGGRGPEISVLEPARAMLDLLCKSFENRSFFNPAKGRALQRPRSKLKTLQNKKPSWAPPRRRHKGDSLLHKGIPLLHKGIPYYTKEFLTTNRNVVRMPGGRGPEISVLEPARAMLGFLCKFL